MSTKALNKARYWMLKSQRRCVSCAEQLPEGRKGTRCAGCAEDQNVYCERRRGRDADADVIVAEQPRCRCGLRLPCWDCLPTVAQMASRRRAA